METVLDKLNDYDLFDGTVVFRDYDFESAIIGMTEDGRLIYDYEKMVEYVMKEDKMTYEEAIDYIDFNTVSSVSVMGKKSPIIMYKLPWE